MIKIGVVGYGEWGPNLVRAMDSLSGVTVSAVCDIQTKNIALAKKRHPAVRAFSDYYEMLNGLDAVVVASPPSIHYPFAKAALKKGIHVLVEKPFVLELDEAGELINLADKNKLVLMVGHILEYHPAVLYIKDFLSSGKAGDIYYLYSQRLNLGRIRREENVIWSFGPHDISAMLFILDRLPREVTVQSESYLQRGIVDVAFITLRFPDGILSHIHLGWLNPNKTRKLTIVGSKKMLVFDDMDPLEKIRIFDKGTNIERRYENYGELISLRNGDITVPFISPAEPLRAECEHFIECIKYAKTPRSDGYDGLRCLRILRAAEDSLKQKGKTQTIKWQ